MADVKCIPGFCDNLRVQPDGTDELGYGKIKCYCKQLKRVILSDEYIEFPKGCPYG